uniref:alpha-N-acetylgalactosaminide alpha-2,6-sialyltransferase n=1 Tax=Geotrypetes seraphini TaxID=260995 RepID=A0A6P8SFJ8_GEOSA|nr:alpha-N-acetylgalactosaminide alpha-2,6-sialyltransferase 2-like [Geotrypetes seraphini]
MALWFRLRAKKLKRGALVTSVAALLLLFRSLELPGNELPRASIAARHELEVPHHEHDVDGTRRRTSETGNGKAALGVYSVPRLKPQPTTTHRPLTTANLNITHFIDQEDEYGEDIIYLKTTCPHSIRKRIAESELKRFFLSTIPVLQWKKHATREEYERLRRYNGAHGWMEVDWHILNETLSLLNSSANGYMFDDWQQRGPANSSCIRCAVVGNGGILNGSRVGAEIDQHDYVFRINGAITNGFEEDVGNRTSFYGFSTNTMQNSLNYYMREGFHEVPKTMETRYIFLPDHNRDYLLLNAALTHRRGNESEHPSYYFGQNLSTEKFKMLHPDFMRYLRNRFLWDPVLNTEDRDVYRVSTGAAMLLAAVHVCDQVSAYGFITPNYGNFSDHYYDRTFKELFFYRNHNLMLEMELWQTLHKDGIIKLYHRTNYTSPQLPVTQQPHVAEQSQLNPLPVSSNEH